MVNLQPSSMTYYFNYLSGYEVMSHGDFDLHVHVD